MRVYVLTAHDDPKKRIFSTWEAAQRVVQNGIETRMVKMQNPNWCIVACYAGTYELIPMWHYEITDEGQIVHIL
jgi:hypothetical protein